MMEKEIMQREIKFRAWHKAEKKMCEVDLLRPGVGAFLIGITPDENKIVELAGKPFVVKSPAEGRFCDWDEFELLEYTGLIDKKGEKIYDGNIIEIKMGETIGSTDSIGRYNSPEMIKYLRKVIWINEYSKFDWEGNKSGSTFCAANQMFFEIIGNIFQNPELLTQNK